jgi:hypothetical protein
MKIIFWPTREQIIANLLQITVNKKAGETGFTNVSVHS